MKQAKHSAGFRLHLMYTPTHAKPAPGHSRAMRAASLFLAAACLLLSVSVYPATAATSMSSLQNKLDKLSQSIVQHKKELSNAKKKEQAAKALESELKEKVTVVQSQISVLKGQIAEVQNSIGLKEQEIAAKEQQITEKEAEIADQWGDFKQHMAAMQELRDGGSVAMLSAVNDLYELLTFNEVMQDISVKDTEIMDEAWRTARTVRHRLVGVGVVSTDTARQLGLVGIAARSSGVAVDLRSTPRGAYAQPAISTCVETSGDCWARAHLRIAEIAASLSWLDTVMSEPGEWVATRPTASAPIGPLSPDQLVISAVEGWRGEVVHCLETDAAGALVHYKVADPSLRNWMGLALAVRGNDISDFPICNKSFDLSYCGNDL